MRERRLTCAQLEQTYIRFHGSLKAQGVDRKTLAYTAPLQPYLTWYALIFICIILLFNGWEVFYDYGSEGFVFDQVSFSGIAMASDSQC